MITPAEYLKYKIFQARKCSFAEYKENKCKIRRIELKLIEEYIDAHLKAGMKTIVFESVEIEDLEIVFDKYRLNNWRIELDEINTIGKFCTNLYNKIFYFIFSINYDKNTQVAQLESELSEHKPE